jgi:WD40 repeat protein
MIATLKTHTDPVYGVAFSHDGKLLASASDDQTTKLWDVSKRKELASLSGSTDAVYAVPFSPDSKVVVAAGADHLLRIWDVSTYLALNQQGSRNPRPGPFPPRQLRAWPGFGG